MPKGNLRSITLDELDNLQLDEAGQLYYLGQAIKFEVGVPEWGRLAAIAVAIATAVGGLATVLMAGLDLARFLTGH